MDTTEPQPAGRIDPKPKNFSETLLGKVLVGVLISAGSAAIALGIAWTNYNPPPLPRPQAVVSPAEIVTRANETVQFSADGSTWSYSGVAEYTWTVGGLPVNGSSIARCSENGSTLTCRFISPGTFAVSLELVDPNGTVGRATSEVTVSIPAGYIGILLREEDDNALRALLYDIDWAELQTAMGGIPILLMDPDSGTNVYAALAQIPAGVSDPPPWRGAASGKTAIVPPLPVFFNERFLEALNGIGVNVVTAGFGTGQVTAQNLLSDDLDFGIMTFSSPDDFSNTQNEF